MRAALALFTLSLVALGAGCAAILGIEDGVPRTDAGVADAEPDVSAPEAGADVDAAPEAGPKPCSATAPFTSIKPIAELNTTGLEQHPRLLPDEKTIVFQRSPSGFVLFVATRPDRTSAFSAPIALSELSTGGDAADPALDPSGLRIVFASSRTGGLGSYDLWTATRPSLGSAFGTPTAVPGGGTAAIDHYPYFAGAGALYFSSARTGGPGSEDIFRMAVTGATFGAPTVVAGLSTTGYDAAPVVSSDELVGFIEHGATLDGGSVIAIHASVRASTADPWPAPKVVTELLGGPETIPGFISADLCRLYFSSDRSGNPDLYVAERQP
jgi:hypothetical protein